MGCELLTLTDLILFVLGIIVGLLLGIGIYWWPLRQFFNELSALKHLILRSYKQGSSVTIKPGDDLTPVTRSFPPIMVTNEKVMKIWHDEGIGWFHRGNGWVRAHVLQVFDEEDSQNRIYRTCHLNLKE